MSELLTPSPEPAYISRMALKGAPFSSNDDEIRFYKGAHYEQKLNLLLHLLRSSDKAAIVIAEPGSGKTALLQQLRQHLTEGVKYCYIQADGNLNQDLLLRECLRAFGIDEADIATQGNLTQLMQQRLIQLRKINLTPVLLIDNADQLPDSAQAQLMSWLQWQQDGHSLLQAVLTARQALTQSPHVERLLQVDLPRLSQAEVGAYLTYRLAAVDFYDPLPFSEKVMKQLYQQSKGNPARLNQLAHQHLLGFNTSAKPPLHIQLVSLLRQSVRWVGVVVLVIIVALLLIYQDAINQWVGANKKTDTHNVEIPALTTQQDMPTVVVGKGNDKVVDADKAERDELRELVSEIPSQSASQATTTASPNSTANHAGQVQQSTQVMPDSAPEKTDKPVTTSQSQGTQPSAAPDETTPTQVIPQTSTAAVSEGQSEQTSTAVEVVNNVHHASWILKQAAENYTFQLMGSWDKTEVGDFIDKYALTGDVAEFASMRKGKVWYALVYGVYPSKQAALDASKKWPAPLNTIPTWLRRFDSVQQQIKDKAPAQ